VLLDDSFFRTEWRQPMRDRLLKQANREYNPRPRLALGYAVVLAADGHSSYSKDAARLIEEWNRKLGEAGVQVMSAAQIEIEGSA
jgi:hypothetical protein